MGIDLMATRASAVQPAAAPAASAQPGTELAAEATPADPAAQGAAPSGVLANPMVAQAMGAAQRPMGMIDRHVWKSVAENAQQPGAREVAMAMLAVSGGELPAEAVQGAAGLTPPGVAPGVPAVQPVNGVPAPGVAPVQGSAGAAPAGAVSPEAAEVVRLVNEARAAKGLAPVALDPALAKVAAAHSRKMASTGKMAHQGIGDGTPGERIRAALGKAAGKTAENVAMGQKNAVEVVKGWMDSAPHRKNILDPSLRTIGVEVVPGPDGTPFWTQVFAG